MVRRGATGTARCRAFCQRAMSPYRLATDEEIITRVLEGDSQAFGLLALRYQGRLFNKLRYMVPSRFDAEDIVQDALLRAYLKLDTFRNRSRFYTWLFRIALNLAHCRARRARAYLSLGVNRHGREFELADPRGATGEQLVRHEEAFAVRQALDRLSEQHRMVLVLREVEGCDYRTIGEMLDLNVGTVRSRLGRARTKLREGLAPLVA
jgi:RNA polymerase sigma-70 factor (ECF subfamily)